MAAAPTSILQFLGSGIVRPFRRGASDVANDNGVNLVRSCVAQCLGTRVGELEWRPEFGSRLHLCKHRKGPVLSALAAYYVTEALSRWEPRVIVTSVVASFDPLGQTLTVDLLYNIITANVPGNQVAVQGVTQSVQIPMAA